MKPAKLTVRIDADAILRQAQACDPTVTEADVMEFIGLNAEGLTYAARQAIRGPLGEAVRNWLAKRMSS